MKEPVTIMRMRRRHSLRRSAATTYLAVVCLLLAGSASVSHRAAAPTRAAGHPVAHQHSERAAPPSAADAALQLQALLGHHSVLAVELMRGRLRGEDDFTKAAAAAAEKNTQAMASLVDSLFGPAAAAQFTDLWSGHITALVDYAGGLVNNEAAARDGATARLETFERTLAAFFAGASQGRLSPQAAQAAVLMHVEHLLRQADAYAARDYPAADRIYRQGYTHSYAMGKTLVAALVTPEDAAVLNSPLWGLRSELSRLLGEHVVLVVSAARAGVTNGPDFAAAAQSVNDNTRELTAAVDSMFGAPAAARFHSLWADHIDQIFVYTTGLVTRDAKRREDAVTRLGTFEAQFAAFLDGATAGRLPSATLAKALLSHDQMLLAQADALSAKQYQQANDGTYATYRHMADLAGQLAEAFGATVASRLPVGGPHTGYGGAAETVGHG
jgi:hypothetical protein